MASLFLSIAGKAAYISIHFYLLLLSSSATRESPRRFFFFRLRYIRPLYMFCHYLLSRCFNQRFIDFLLRFLLSISILISLVILQALEVVYSVMFCFHSFFKPSVYGLTSLRTPRSETHLRCGSITCLFCTSSSRLPQTTTHTPWRPILFFLLNSTFASSSVFIFWKLILVLLLSDISFSISFCLIALLFYTMICSHMAPTSI